MVGFEGIAIPDTVTGQFFESLFEEDCGCEELSDWEEPPGSEVKRSSRSQPESTEQDKHKVKIIAKKFFIFISFLRRISDTAPLKDLLQ